MTKHILIVDDDQLMTRSVAFSLQKAGYVTSTASSAEDALAMLQSKQADAILLDIVLPGMDGLAALRVFQQVTSAPIIFITARRRELDEILGLELGADDYITKPFDTDVLLAHLRAVLRRSSASQENVLPAQPVQAGNLVIDPDGRMTHIDDREIVLSPKEFDLLLLLASKPGRVFSVDELLKQVWGPDWVGESQTIYVHVHWLREKIEQDASQPHRLLTVKGAGYKLVPIEE